MELYKKAGLVVVGIVMALVLGELAVRLFVPISDSFWIGDEHIGVKLRPNAQGWWLTSNHATFVQINAEGFRDTDHQAEKPPCRYRILILGDSFTEAVQVPLNETFYKVLETKLQATYGNKVEVIAIGVSGAGAAREYLAWDYYGKKYQPNMVILQATPSNDVWDDYRVFSQHTDTPYFRYENGTLYKLPFKPDFTTRNTLSYVKQQSKLLTLLYDTFKKITADQTAMQRSQAQVYEKPYNDEWGKAWELYLLTVSALERDAYANNATFMVLIGTNALQTGEETWHDYPHIYDKDGMLVKDINFNRPGNIIGTYCVLNGWTCIEPIVAFNQYRGSTLHYPNDGHWTPLAHAIVGNMLYSEVSPYVKDYMEQDAYCSFPNRNAMA